MPVEPIEERVQEPEQPSESGFLYTIKYLIEKISSVLSSAFESLQHSLDTTQVTNKQVTIQVPNPSTTVKTFGIFRKLFPSTNKKEINYNTYEKIYQFQTSNLTKALKNIQACIDSQKNKSPVLVELKQGDTYEIREYNLQNKTWKTVTTNGIHPETEHRNTTITVYSDKNTASRLQSSFELYFDPETHEEAEFLDEEGRYTDPTGNILHPETALKTGVADKAVSSIITKIGKALGLSGPDLDTLSYQKIGQQQFLSGEKNWKSFTSGLQQLLKPTKSTDSNKLLTFFRGAFLFSREPVSLLTHKEKLVSPMYIESFLSSLSKYLEDTQIDTPLLFHISIGSKQLSIGYDPKDKSWQLIDDRVPFIPSISNANLLSKLFSRHLGGGDLSLSIEALDPPNTLQKALIDWQKQNKGVSFRSYIPS